jgi:hypothetical protein
VLASRRPGNFQKNLNEITLRLPGVQGPLPRRRTQAHARARGHPPRDSDSPGGLLETAITDVADCRHYECHVDTLDRQLLVAGRVMVLKVDVDGHGLNVFRGAQEILTRAGSSL